MLNAMRTTFFLAALTGLFMVIGFVVGGQPGMVLALGFSIATNAVAYWNADKMILRLQNAEPLGRSRAPQLFNIVETLSARAKIPTPRLFIIHTAQPNAFATGRNPANSTVVVSSGLLENLEAHEVGAVIAHELAHIRSRDTLIMTISATFAGAISMLAQFGLFFGSRSSSNPVGPIGSILMIVLAPVVALLVQMAISRTREYEADRDGAEISGDPLALATALEKISKLARNFENPWARRNSGMAHLFIINPLAGPGGDNLFSTHPDVKNRIAALRQMASEVRTLVRADGAPNRRARIKKTGSGWRVPTIRQSGGNDDPSGPWG